MYIDCDLKPSILNLQPDPVGTAFLCITNLLLISLLFGVHAVNGGSVGGAWDDLATHTYMIFKGDLLAE